MKTLLPKVFLLLILVFLTSKYVIYPAFSVSPAHIVINEIQIAGNTASDEFVELFNQSNQDQTLSNWVIKKKSDSGYETTLSAFSATISAHGYLLFGHTNYDGSILKDISYASTIGNNNTLYLFDNNNLLIDKVGMGLPFESETSPASEPLANTSIERINHQDTDNNLNDFVVNNSPDPQNSLSPIDPPLVSPSPSPLSTPTTFPTPSTSALPSPTVEPSLIPSPSLEPSIEPTIIPSASPEVSPTPISSPSPTPTTFPTPSAFASLSPSPTISPTPIPSDRILFNQFGIMCKLQYSAKKIMWLIYYIPKLICTTHQ